MAREVIIKTWCDPCLADEQTTEGQELPPITLPGLGKPRVLALCEVHRKELYEPLAEVLRELGQIVQPDGHTTPGRPGPKPGTTTRHPQLTGGDWKCPVAEQDPAQCDYPGGPSRNALDQHCRSHHGGSLAKLEGSPVAVCSAPGCEVEMTHPSGWTTHWSRTHPELRKPPWPGLPSETHEAAPSRPRKRAAKRGAKA